MCNHKKRSIARSLRSKRLNTLNLTQPYVAVADEVDGLIKTVDLTSDVEVIVKVWFGATEEDAIQLRLDGAAVGEIVKLGPAPIEGSTMILKIPVSTELLLDGVYRLDYAVTGYPGGNLTISPAISIQVDRTPPGAHQLGYMDFPDEARDGLTAEELFAMGDVLTAQIYGYTGLTKGDVIQTFWGQSAGPEVLLTGDEDGSRAIEVEFGRDFLRSVESNAGATFYTVKDRAGNVSSPSKMITIPLFLTEVISDLPPPVVDDADGLINYEEANAGVGVKIPSSAMLTLGDAITLRWGSVLLGPVNVDPEDIPEQFVLNFDVDLQTVQQAGDGLRQLNYEVIRGGRTVGVSSNIELDVFATLPVPGPMTKPTVKGGSGTPSAEDNVIDENDFEINATILINWNINFIAGQILTVYWAGSEVLANPYVITNTDVAAGRTLVLTALKDKFQPIGTGSDIRVNYTVTYSDNPNTSTSPEQSIIVISRDELPGGSSGPEAPEFSLLNENGAINDELSINGAPVYIKPYENISSGQVIIFTYKAYDDLVSGNLKFTWTHTSANLTGENVLNGYNLSVPRAELQRHCYGHAEASFQVLSDKGQGNSKSASAYVDLRHAGVCVG